MRRLLLFALILPVVFVCAGAAQARQSGTTLNLVAYSTPKPVMQKLITRFAHTSAGNGIAFSQSYGPSGSQARAIVAGQPASIAFLSTGLDIDALADAGLVSKSWDHAPYSSIAADSVVAFVVRKGNPKHIHTWAEPTMLIELPMVALKNAPSAAKAFITYAHAPKQQAIFAANGYRPVVKSVLKRSDLASWAKKYGTGPTFNIRDRLFGGWRKANRVWFDPNTGRMVGIERAIGGPSH